MTLGTFLVIAGLVLAVVDIAVGFVGRWTRHWVLLAVAVILISLGILVGVEPFITT